MRNLTPRQRAFAAALLVGCAVGFAGGRAQAADGPRLKVFIPEFRADSGSPVNGETATQIVAQRLGKLNFFDFISQEDVAAELDYAALQQALGNDDVNVLQAIGKQAQADKMIYGTVGLVASAVVCTVTMIDIASGDVERRVARTAKAEDRSVVVQTLAALADGILAYLLRQYAPDKMKSTGRRWQKYAHPAGWGLLGGGLGLLAGAAVMHATYDPQAAVWATYGAGALLTAVGATVVLTGIGGARVEVSAQPTALSAGSGLPAAPGLMLFGRFP